MKPTFVSTIKNVQNFMTAFSALLGRGAPESCIMLVDGRPGLGKTKTAMWWATQRGAWRVRAQARWTQSWMLQDLYHAVVGQDTSQRSGKDLYKALLQRIGDHQGSMARKGRQPVIVIDEADHAIQAGNAVLDTLRGITDMTEIPTVLVGMNKIEKAFSKRNPQMWSRIGQRLTFDPLSIEDCRQLVDGVSEVAIADDLLEFVHTSSKGYTRELYAAIARVERAGRRVEGPVTRAHLSGQVILHDRDTSDAVVVP
jgi:DNA transposition AAA+ family ATPase